MITVLYTRWQSGSTLPSRLMDREESREGVIRTPRHGGQPAHPELKCLKGRQPRLRIRIRENERVEWLTAEASARRSPSSRSS